MVDCRPAAGAPAHELAHGAPPNGAPQPPPQENNHHNQMGSGDMSHGVASPAARASTPAASTAIAPYPPASYPPNGPMAPAPGYGYYGGKLGSVVWMPPPPQPPPPPHPVNPHVYKSVQLNGADLPMNDIPTLRYYFNLGVECMWAAYGPPPPRHYAQRDISQDMQQMSLHERGHEAGPHNKHKPADNKPPQQNKGAGQRSLLGPRFNKRNQEGNQNPNHNQNKHNNNNNMNNKGPNNRRNSHESRPGAYPPEGECVVEPPLLTVPYLSYPPPVYPVQYYPVDADPGMMSMMGGMGYVNYEEGGEYPPPAYYPQPMYPPPHMHPHMAPHQEHK